MNLNFVRVWLNVLVSPGETLRKEKNNASLLKAVVYFLFSSVVPVLIVNFFWLVFAFFSGAPVKFDFFVSVLYQEMVIVLSILVLILFFFNVITFIVAKFFKGKGNITTQAYLVSLAISPILFVLILLGIFLFLAYFFVFLLLFIIAIILISYYSTIALLETHEFNKVNQIKKLIIVVLVLILLIFELTLTLTILTVFFSSAGFFPKPQTTPGANQEAYRNAYNKLYHTVT